MALRQELEEPPCLGEMKTLVYIIGGRADLTAMHERYMHECNVHNDFTGCENSKTVLESLKDRSILDQAITELTDCLHAQIRRTIPRG